MTGKMTQNILLTSEKKEQTNLLTQVWVPKDSVHSHHAQEEDGMMAPTLPPFVRPGSLHARTFVESYTIQAIFIASDFDPKP